MPELIIREDFRRLIPQLSEEEFDQLETNIIKDGILSPIVVWQNIIIDGHNRYEIAQKWDLLFEFTEKEFEDENDVKEWMILHQFGRRNLSNYQRSVLALQLENVIKAKAKDRQRLHGGTAPGRTLVQNSEQVIDEKPMERKTISQVAKVANVSHDTILKVKAIQEKAPDDILVKLEKDEISIHKAYETIVKDEKFQKLEEKKREISSILASQVLNNRPILTNTDCISYLSQFEDDSIDLVITDPPYSTDIDDIELFAEWVHIAMQKTKRSGRLYICIGAYPKEIMAYLDILLKQNKFIVDNPLIWTYRNTLGVTPKMKYNLNYQMILHLYSDNSVELDTSITNEMFSVQDINAPDGRLGNRYHTWQKPDELALRLIRHSTKEGDLVVDCFACTGTFPLMAAKLNRVARGCDISIENLNIANERGCIIQ